MENEEVKHKRRVRYSGTHPRRFEEKYKELNPEKYSRDIEHIISRGATPAGMHISIMVSEILEFLDIKPGAVSVMGLMNDKNNRVRLLVDEDVLKGEYVGCHPCVNTSSLKIKTADVFGKYLDAVHHTATTVKLVGED